MEVVVVVAVAVEVYYTRYTVYSSRKYMYYVMYDYVL